MDTSCELSSGDESSYELFKQDTLFAESFPLMKEIRRQGKLCDVTLKVSVLWRLLHTR